MPKVENYLPLLNLIYGQWKVCEHKIIYCLSTALLYGRNSDVLEVLNSVCVFTLTPILLVALCNLVAASFREDNYGVVQKTLPQILTSVIKLQEVSV